MTALNHEQFATYIAYHEGEEAPVDASFPQQYLDRLDDTLLEEAAKTRPDLQ